MRVKEAKFNTVSDIGINIVPLISDIEQRFGYDIDSDIKLSNPTLITIFDIRHRFRQCHIQP
jgi:hypothetical protein